MNGILKSKGKNHHMRRGYDIWGIKTQKLMAVRKSASDGKG